MSLTDRSLPHSQGGKQRTTIERETRTTIVIPKQKAGAAATLEETVSTSWMDAPINVSLFVLELISGCVCACVRATIAIKGQTSTAVLSAKTRCDLVLASVSSERRSCVSHERLLIYACVHSCHRGIGTRLAAVHALSLATAERPSTTGASARTPSLCTAALTSDRRHAPIDHRESDATAPHDRHAEALLARTFGHH